MGSIISVELARNSRRQRGVTKIEGRWIQISACLQCTGLRSRKMELRETRSHTNGSQLHRATERLRSTTTRTFPVLPSAPSSCAISWGQIVSHVAGGLV